MKNHLTNPKSGILKNLVPCVQWFLFTRDKTEIWLVEAFIDLDGSVKTQNPTETKFLDTLRLSPKEIQPLMEPGAGSDIWGQVFRVEEVSRLPLLIQSGPRQCAHQEASSPEESPRQWPCPQSDIPRSFRVTQQMRMDARSCGFDFRMMDGEGILYFLANSSIERQVVFVEQMQQVV